MDGRANQEYSDSFLFAVAPDVTWDDAVLSHLEARRAVSLILDRPA